MANTSCFMAALVSAVALAGCGTSIEFTQTHARPPGLNPRPPATVEILTAGPPQRPYTELGLIEAHQQSGMSTDDRQEVLMKLRTYAGQVGCDAILVANDTAIDNVYTTKQVTTVARQGFRATCLVYNGPAGAPPAGPPPGPPPAAAN